MGTEKKLTRKPDEQKTAVVKPTSSHNLQPSTHQTAASPNPARLQQTIGNQAAHRFYKIQLQRKMTLGPVGDKYEQEADAVAKQVVSTLHHAPKTETAVSTAQRQEEEEEMQMKPAATISSLQRQEDEEEMQAKGEPMLAGGELSDNVETAVTQAKSGGQPMHNTVRQPMEQAFGANFGNVKIHTDAQSDQLNRSLQARAFTSGQDVFFRQGEYNPGSASGQELIAHELTHVVQQNGTAVQCHEEETAQRHPAPYVAQSEEEEIQTKRLPGAVSPTKQKSILQRAFQPATTTSKTHLRTYTGTKVNTGTKTGRNIPSNSEVIIDQARQYTQKRKVFSDVTWTRAVDTTAPTWDPVSSPATGGYIRQTKVTPKTYPENTTVFVTFRGDLPAKKQWREDLGEYLEVEKSAAYPADWLIKIGGQFKRLPSGGPPPVALNLLEKTQLETHTYKLFGPSPSDPQWLLITRQGGTPVKYKPSSKEEDMNPVLTQEETNAIKEKPIKDHFEMELAKDPQMATGNLTSTTFSYQPDPLVAPVNVYIKGNNTANLYGEQLAAVQKGLTDLQTKGVPLDDGLEIYISSSDKPLQAAYNFGAGRIILKSTMFDNPEMDDERSDEEGIKGGVPKSGVFGVAHQIARRGNLNAQQKRKAIGSAVAVHEVGHAKHKLSSPVKFQKLQKGELTEQQLSKLADAAKEVSHYAATAPGDPNKALELVAEVFTGITYGEQYSRDVIDLYLDLGGFKLWNNDDEVVL